MFKEFETSSILIHVAFHYVEERLPFLERLLRTFCTYRFDAVHVVVDTNWEGLVKRLDQERYKKIFLTLSLHKDLKDPYLLTWAHRAGMEKKINNYDYFMYVEDDIEVPYNVIERWRKDSIVLAPKGYMRGFLRKETDGKAEYAADQKDVMTYKNIVLVSGEPYLHPLNPYQGFWIYSKTQMMRFMESNCWRDGNKPEWGIRERAAAGMIWIDRNTHTVLVPLDAGYKICREASVRHLPNNYVYDKSTKLGKIPVGSLIRLNRYSVAWLKIKSLFQKYGSFRLVTGELV